MLFVHHGEVEASEGGFICEGHDVNLTQEWDGKWKLTDFDGIAVFLASFSFRESDGTDGGMPRVLFEHIDAEIRSHEWNTYENTTVAISS